MKNRRPLYFDYMATTPIDPRVVNKMMAYMGPEGMFGNPASTSHRYGEEAAKAVAWARAAVADSIGAIPEAVVFTSGATEANNLAILGAARFYKHKGRHLVTMSTEHKSVLDGMARLARDGFEVTYLHPQPNGLLDLDILKAALRDDTLLVSIMHVNNEIGVIQDIGAIGELLQGRGILFHVDAAQSAGRCPLDLHYWNVDLLSLSAHKNYGPKGIGALYVRQKPRVRLEPQSFGGGQEAGLRSGTLATHQIVGMGEAFLVAESERIIEQARLLKLRHVLWSGISGIKGIQLNGDLEQRVAGNLNVSVRGVDGAALMSALHEIAVSTKSACASASMDPSYVLQALGRSPALADSAIRLSLGRFTTLTDVEKAVDVLCTQIPRLQQENQMQRNR